MSDPGTPVRKTTERRRPVTVIPDRLTERGRSSGRLGYFLAWAVVYADIGTSIYYVPGLLFTELGGITPSPAGVFVLATGLAVILLALKYVDVSARYPDGGGVVSVASDAFGPGVGCLGGILICVSYFLTGAISAVSGFQYLAGLLPVLDHWLVTCACTAIVFLGVLNYIGIQESAIFTAVLAIGSFVVNVVLMAFVALQIDSRSWALVAAQFRSAGSLTTWPLLVGFSGSWLAYSGLESISQIAPALREPRQRTALKAMVLVMAAILMTSPLITAFETALLNARTANPERFLLDLGEAFSPRWLQLAIVLTASTLLMAAANTAIIGCYHVFLALVRLGYLPHWLSARNLRFNTPHRAIVLSVGVPVLVIVAAQGKIGVLGHLYTFGLLGAFTLTSLGLDKIRWQERAQGATFYFGTVTSVLVLGAWGINLVHQRTATLVGITVTAVCFALTLAVRRGWIGGVRSGFATAEAAERAATGLATAVNIVTVDEAVDMSAIYKSTTLVAMRAPNLRLFQEAAARVRGNDENAVYLLFVDEVPGLFFPPKTGPSHEACSVMETAVDFFKSADIVAIPIWRMAHDAGASVAGAAKRLNVETVMVGTSQRTAVWHLLRGSVLKSLMRDLPETTRVWICN